MLTLISSLLANERLRQRDGLLVDFNVGGEKKISLGPAARFENLGRHSSKWAAEMGFPAVWCPSPYAKHRRSAMRE